MTCIEYSSDMGRSAYVWNILRVPFVLRGTDLVGHLFVVPPIRLATRGELILGLISKAFGFWAGLNLFSGPLSNVVDLGLQMLKISN